MNFITKDDLVNLDNANTNFNLFIQGLCLDAARNTVKEAFESSGEFYNAYLRYKEEGYDKKYGYSIESFVRMQQFIRDYETNEPIKLKGVYVKLDDKEYRLIKDGKLINDFADMLNKLDNSSERTINTYINKINNDYNFDGKYDNLIEELPSPYGDLTMKDIDRCYYDGNWLYFELNNLSVD